MRNTLVALCLVALILGFAGGFTVARLRYKPLLAANSAAIIAKDSEITALKEKDLQSAQKMSAESGTEYKMVNGKMMMDAGGSQSAVLKDIVLADGTKVMSNGTVMKKDGEKIKLSEGESFGVK